MTEIPRKDAVCDTEKITGNWSDQVFERVEFFNCEFKNCVFERAIFRECMFENCEFESSDLSLASIVGSSFSPTVFKKCKLHGIAWHQVGFAFDVAFLDSHLDYSSFFGMKLGKIRFTGSRLTEVTFVDSIVRDGNFVGCDLSGTVFNHTDLSRANFMGAQNYTIDVTNNQVKGATFELPEAVRLLSFFGIKIK